MFDQAKTFVTQHKNLTILGGLLLLLVVVSLPLLLTNNSGTKQNSVSPENSSAQNPSTSPDDNKFNPLIDNRDINKVQDAYETQYEKLGKKITPPIHYKIHLEITPTPGNKSSFLPVEQSYAAECNVSGPMTVSGYALKSGYGLTDAETLATTYGFSGSVMSEVPMEDGKNFAYYFSDEAASSFLQIAEPSGASGYHIAIPGDAPNDPKITAVDAEKKANDELVKYKLTDYNSKVIPSTDVTTGKFVFSYPKKYGTLQLLDLASIKESKGSVCGIVGPKNMGYEEVRVSDKGTIAKVINQARTVTGKYDLKTESFSDAVKEYGDKLPTDPILISGSLGKSDDIGIKSVGDSTLVYFDYGDNYAQLTYIPVYLTEAKTTTGAIIVAVVPAVSQAEIDKTPLGEIISTKLNLQLQSFNPAPPKSSTAPVGGCYGHLVDYRIACTDNGQQVCNIPMISINSNHDPYGVCSSGCQNHDETIQSDNTGAKVCGDVVKFLQGSTPSGSKSYVCHINGCPC